MKSDKMSIKQLSEQGVRSFWIRNKYLAFIFALKANFLRTYLPDVDVTSELIREHLAEDIAMSRMLEKFDPHLGNLLDVFRPESTPSQPYLLFPTGEDNCSLSKACLELLHAPADFPLRCLLRRIPWFAQRCFSSPVAIILFPDADTTTEFVTPLARLGPIVRRVRLLSYPTITALAVRSFGPLKILKLKPDEHSEGLRFSELAAFSVSDFGSEMVVDMKFPSLSPKLFTVGHKGSLFECDFVSGAKGM